MFNCVPNTGLIDAVGGLAKDFKANALQNWRRSWWQKNKGAEDE
jgi:hypothetical protein